MRAVVVGAGLGGLATALRLQGAGRGGDRGRAARRGPGGRAYQLRDGGFTWDTGPSLLTMPWVLEETFAAGGLDLHAELDAAPARPAVPDPLGAARTAHFDFAGDPARLREEVAKFSARDAAQVEPFLAALRADLRATASSPPGGGRSCAPGTSRGSCPTWCGSTRCGPLHAFVARYFEHPRVREAFSFHSLFIGGDPYRVPAIYGALVYLQVARRRLVRRRRRLRRGRGDGRAARRALRRAGRGDRARRRARDRRAARGRRADRGRRRGLQRRRPAHARARRPRRAAPPAARDDVLLPALPRHGPAVRRRCCTTRCSSATATASSSAPSRAAASCRARSRPTSTRRRAPRRRWRRAGRRLARRAAARCPTCAPGSTGTATATGCATRCVADLEASFGLTGSTRRGRRRAPDDAAGLRARPRRGVGERVRRRADAAPVGLLPPAEPRPAASRGLYFAGGGTHPGRGRARRAARRRGHRGADRARPRPLRAAPGGGLRDRRRTQPARRRRCREARATTNRVARTFALACRLLPRPVRDDVYLLYLVFRTLDDLVDDGRPDAAERVAAVDAWARGGAGPSDARGRGARGARGAPPAPARRARRLLRGDALGPRRPRVRHRGRAGRLLLPRGRHGRRSSWRAVLGTTDDARARPAAAALGMAMQRTNILRDLDEDGAAGRAYLARETTDRFGAPVPGRARGAAARPDRARPTRATTRAWPASRCCARAAAAVARRGVDVPRDPAPDRARRLRRPRRPRRRCGGAASSGWSPGAAPVLPVTSSVALTSRVARPGAPASVDGIVAPPRRSPPACCSRCSPACGGAGALGGRRRAAGAPAARRRRRGRAARAPRRRPPAPARPPRRRLLRRAAGRRSSARSASARPTRPRAGCCGRRRPYERPRPPGAARARADRRRSPTPTRARTAMYRTRQAGRRHPPLPARRAAPRDAAHARHPARPLGLLHGGRRGSSGGCASRTSASRSTRSGACSGGEVPGQVIGHVDAARGQRDLGVAGAARRAPRAAAEAVRRPPVHRGHGRRHAAQAARRARDGAQRRRLRHAARRRSPSTTRSPARPPALRPGLQALLRGGRRA